AVAFHFVRCDQLTGGLAPPGVRPCWAHIKKAGTPPGLIAHHRTYFNCPWQCLYFFPLPHGQGSLRPTLGTPPITVPAIAADAAAGGSSRPGSSPRNAAS